MNEFEKIKLKIKTIDILENELQKYTDSKIIFTNGCFDILHLGHIEYLAKSKDLGDLLIVGLNSDKSVKKLKGEKRPINNQDMRSIILASLSFVDIVIIFDEDTPEKLIHMIKPDVLVKGGDYNIESVVGSKFVKSYGGDIKIINFVNGYSTSAIINKMNHSTN